LLKGHAWLLEDGEVLPVDLYNHARIAFNTMVDRELVPVEELEGKDSETIENLFMDKFGAVHASGDSFRVWKLTSKAIRQIQGYISSNSSRKPTTNDSIFIEEVSSGKYFTYLKVSEFLLARSVSDVNKMGIKSKQGKVSTKKLRGLRRK